MSRLVTWLFARLLTLMRRQKNLSNSWLDESYLLDSSMLLSKMGVGHSPRGLRKGSAAKAQTLSGPLLFLGFALDARVQRRGAGEHDGWIHGQNDVLLALQDGCSDARRRGVVACPCAACAHANDQRCARAARSAAGRCVEIGILGSSSSLPRDHQILGNQSERPVASPDRDLRRAVHRLWEASAHAAR